MWVGTLTRSNPSTAPSGSQGCGEAHGCPSCGVEGVSPEGHQAGLCTQRGVRGQGLLVKEGRRQGQKCLLQPVPCCGADSKPLKNCLELREGRHFQDKGRQQPHSLAGRWEWGPSPCASASRRDEGNRTPFLPGCGPVSCHAVLSWACRHVWGEDACHSGCLEWAMEPLGKDRPVGRGSVGKGDLSEWPMVLDLCARRRVSVGAMSLHGGSSDPQRQVRPKAQARARGGLHLAATDPAVHTHLSQDRAPTKITEASDPQQPADHQSGHKQKPTVHTQATIPLRVPWA